MISGNRPQLGSQRRAAQVVELVGVDLERETQVTRGLQDTAGLLQAEGSNFTEGVHEGQRPFRGIVSPPGAYSGQHRCAQVTRIPVWIAFELRGDGVRSEERRVGKEG